VERYLAEKILIGIFSAAKKLLIEPIREDVCSKNYLIKISYKSYPKW